ncbi:hypothetical protein [Bacillus sp. CGMCC 1.16541]|uniref:hypothetical protein n=1 Tax=Bacillus sp. CGMCC 1.16541 TaxID=2185143 RepID=UPI000D73E564|nr:hypothetical protein [Bacillus sp. CGMCC 1.16541]
MIQDRSNWVTKEQLDTPLRDIFQGVKTNGTARIYVASCEVILGIEPSNLEAMSYEEMNKYIDSLDRRMAALANG